MDDKTIFVITVFEKCGLTDQGWLDIGSARSPGFRYTFELAEEAVKLNMCDMWEYCYNYAAIHEIGSELYPVPRMSKYYKYNRDIDGYEPIEEPECLKHFNFCGIG